MLNPKTGLKQKSLHISGGFYKIWWDEGGIQQLNLLQAQLIDSISLTRKEGVLTESFLRQKYLHEGLSSSEIAALSFSSRQHITSKLKTFGIPLKTVTRRESGRMVFGFRQYGGRAIEVKKETEIIDLIKSYRASGYSYLKIADMLNDKKIQTKMRKGFWYSKVVRQIFLRATAK